MTNSGGGNNSSEFDSIAPGFDRINGPEFSLTIAAHARTEITSGLTRIKTINTRILFHRSRKTEAGPICDRFSNSILNGCFVWIFFRSGEGGGMERKRETGWCFYLLISLCLFFFVGSDETGGHLAE